MQKCKKKEIRLHPVSHFGLVKVPYLQAMFLAKLGNKNSGVMDPTAKSLRNNLTTCILQSLERRHAYEAVVHFPSSCQKNKTKKTLGLGMRNML